MKKKKILPKKIDRKNPPKNPVKNPPKIFQKIRHKKLGIWQFFPSKNCKKQPLVIFITNDSVRVKLETIFV